MADEKNENEKSEKVVLEASGAQLDAERRAEEADKEEAPVDARFVSVNPTYGVEEDGGYIVVSPEYRNAADARQEPKNPEDGWTEKLRVEPAEDAGKETVPVVPAHAPGGPRVDVDMTNARTTAQTVATKPANTTAAPAKAAPASKPTSDQK